MAEYPPIVQMRPNRCGYCDIIYAALGYTLDAAIERGYDVTDLAGDLATRADLERIIAEKSPIFFHGAGHGNSTTFTGQDTNIVLQVGLNEEVCAGMIVYLLSCLTGLKLGPAIIATGGWAYIGYTVEWTWMDEDAAGDPYQDKCARGFYEGSNAIVIAFLDGLTAKEAKQAGYDKYTEWIDYWSKSDDPDASECIHWLIYDRDNCIQLGDEGASTQVPTHTLTVNSEPTPVEFTVNGMKGVTPWSKKLAERTFTITAASRIYTPTAIYGFDHWEDNTTNRTRTINLTANMTVTAYYIEVSAHILTVNSEPAGVEFIINEEKTITPFSQLLEEGVHTVVMPSRVFIDGTVYDFLNWEDGSIDTVRSIDLMANITVTANYILSPKHTLLVKSNPSGIPFTIDDSTRTTPWIGSVLEGSYKITVPQEVEI